MLLCSAQPAVARLANDGVVWLDAITQQAGGLSASFPVGDWCVQNRMMAWSGSTLVFGTSHSVLHGEVVSCVGSQLTQKSNWDVRSTIEFSGNLCARADHLMAGDARGGVLVIWVSCAVYRVAADSGIGDRLRQAFH